MTNEYRFDQIAIVSTEKKRPTDADKNNYIGLEHLSPDTFDVVDYGSEVAPKGEKLVMRKGDVLFGKRRAYQKKVGIAPCDGIFSAHGMVLRPNEEVVDSRFFPFFIKSDCFLDEAIRISVGSLSPTVNWRDLRELRFQLPDIERQHELAELLWAGENDLSKTAFCMRRAGQIPVYRDVWRIRVKRVWMAKRDAGRKNSIPYFRIARLG